MRRGKGLPCLAARWSGLGLCGLLLAGAIAGEARPAAAQALMELPGSFQVDERGGASYSIPIAAPPGTGGMVPALTLDYRSGFPNGLVGVGWSLGGIPAIVRCPQTQAQDGNRGAVNFDSEDRYCLDGQRLMLVSGTYGRNGAAYRTEIEGFSRITSHGNLGGGPRRFEVRTKSGQWMEFGGTEDSQHRVSDGSTVRSWGLNRVEDTVGNYLTVSYSENQAQGEIRPTRIDYTGNDGAGLAPYNSIRFGYETRPDTISGYTAGEPWRTSRRLTRIRAFNGGNMVREYVLHYEEGASTGRSRLQSVELCGPGDAGCLPATSFTYTDRDYATDSGHGFRRIANPAGQNGVLQNHVPVGGDFTGNGRTDLLWYRVDGNGHSQDIRTIWLSEGGGDFTVLSDVSGPTDTRRFYPYVADFNGNGRTDILWASSQNNTRPVLWLSNGDGTFVSASQLAQRQKSEILDIGDYDGDGRADVLWRDGDLWLGRGNGFAYRNIIAADGDDLDLHKLNRNQWRGRLSGVDYDGDGRSDIFTMRRTVGIIGKVRWEMNMRFYSDYTIDQQSNHAISQSRIFHKDEASYNSRRPQFYAHADYFAGDFNGDGNDDLLWVYAEQGWRKLWFSSGRSIPEGMLTRMERADVVGDGPVSLDRFEIQQSVNGTAASLKNYEPYVFDVNGDGLSDILWNHEGQKRRVLWLSNGDGSFREIENLRGDDGTRLGEPLVGDFDGDGLPDILWLERDGKGRSKGTHELWLSKGPLPDLLRRVDTGLGALTQVTFQTLSQSDGSQDSHYIRGSDASGVVVDVQGPMPVVTRVVTSNGIGGTRSSTYRYAGAQVHRNGRGFLGFAEVVARDNLTGIERRTRYHQDFPFTGMVVQSRTKLGQQELERVTNSYASINLGFRQWAVELREQVQRTWDLDGTALPRVTTTWRYDDFGNPTEVVVSTPDGASTTTVNNYSNNTNDWLLGRLTGSSVTRTVP